MSQKRFDTLIRKLKGRSPLLGVLIDPDKFSEELIRLCEKSLVSCFLVGGSVLEKGNLEKTVLRIRKLSQIPIVLFPGDETQLSRYADGLLLLSLLSGRNPDYLIGKHIAAAPFIRKMRLPHLSTAYLLISSGAESSTQKVTQTDPLDPADFRIIVNTAIAAEQLGFKALYLEAGSGATESLSPTLIKKVKGEVELPLIVGGGINSAEKTKALIKAGANMLVLGNALEKDVHLLREISQCFGSNRKKKAK